MRVRLRSIRIIFMLLFMGILIWLLCSGLVLRSSALADHGIIWPLSLSLFILLLTLPAIKYISSAAGKIFVYILLLIVSMLYIAEFPLMVDFAENKSSIYIGTLFSVYNLGLGPDGTLKLIPYILTLSISVAISAYTFILLPVTITRNGVKRLSNRNNTTKMGHLFCFSSIVLVVMLTLQKSLGLNAGNSLPFYLSAIVNLLAGSVLPILVTTCHLILDSKDRDRYKFVRLVTLAVLSLLALYAGSSKYMIVMVLASLGLSLLLKNRMSQSYLFFGIIAATTMYPLLNLFRLSTLSGQDMIEIVNRRIETADMEIGGGFIGWINTITLAFRYGLLSVAGRFVTLDPMMIYLSSSPTKSDLAFIYTYGVDQYLTRRVLGITFEMGYGSGFIGSFLPFVDSTLQLLFLVSSVIIGILIALSFCESSISSLNAGFLPCLLASMIQLFMSGVKSGSVLMIVSLTAIYIFLYMISGERRAYYGS